MAKPRTRKPRRTREEIHAAWLASMPSVRFVEDDGTYTDIRWNGREHVVVGTGRITR